MAFDVPSFILARMVALDQWPWVRLNLIELAFDEKVAVDGAGGATGSRDTLGSGFASTERSG